MYFGHQTILQLKSGFGILLLGERRTGDGKRGFSAISGFSFLSVKWFLGARSRAVASRDDCPMYYGHPTILQLKSGFGIVLLGGRRTGDGERVFSAFKDPCT